MWTMVVAVGIVGVSCTRAPRERIANAQAAVQAAERNEAELYAPARLSQARKMLDDALTEVGVQDAKWTFFRSYDRANDLLWETINLAHEASRRAASVREESKLNAEDVVRDAEQAVQSARKALANVYGSESPRDEWQATLEAASSHLFEAEKAFENGKYDEAHAKAEDAKAQADEVAEAVTDATSRHG
jgi:uncharacterized protein (UPF0332 family)